MRILHKAMVALTLLSLSSLGVHSEDGILSDNIRIESEKLGYALQYRVYTPAGHKDASNLPTIYITDGQWYISEGKMHKVLNRHIDKGKVKPVVAIFVDSRNPDKLRENRRNYQFFCNLKYSAFFEDELVPHITQNYNVSTNRDDRVILGLSFGGLNSACFGMAATKTFRGIAMQSPAMHPVPKLYDIYKEVPTQPIDIFFSIGTPNDNTNEGRRFRRILKEKNYKMLYKEVPEGHNWRNWKPLLDDILHYYFKA